MDNIIDSIIDSILNFLIKQFTCIYCAYTAIEIIGNVIKDDLPLNIRRMKANIFLSTLDKFYYNVEAL